MGSHSSKMEKIPSFNRVVLLNLTHEKENTITIVSNSQIKQRTTMEFVRNSTYYKTSKGLVSKETKMSWWGSGTQNLFN